jgi:hypothetical protein
VLIAFFESNECVDGLAGKFVVDTDYSGFGYGVYRLY